MLPLLIGNVPDEQLGKQTTIYEQLGVPINYKKDTTPDFEAEIGFTFSFSCSVCPWNNKLSETQKHPVLPSENTYTYVDEKITPQDDYEIINNTRLSSPCDYYKIFPNRYIIKESAYAIEGNARRKVQKLKSLGFSIVSYVFLPCYTNSINQELYIVVLGRSTKTYSSAKEQQKLIDYKARQVGYTLNDNEILYLGVK